MKSDDKIKEWANKNSGVHPHRPAGNYGPFTALFHPALGMLKHHLMHLDQIEDPSAAHYKLAYKFITICNDGFKKEDRRQARLRGIIEGLIGEDAEWQKNFEGGTAVPDAVWGWRQVIWAIMELKNVDGMGGNATLQAVLDYSKLISQSQVRSSMTFAPSPADFFA